MVFIYSILTFIIVFSITTLKLDKYKFKLSDNKFIKVFQILSPLFFVLLLLILYLEFKTQLILLSLDHTNSEISVEKKIGK